MNFQDLKAMIESTIKEVFDTMLSLEIDSQEVWSLEGGTDDLVAGDLKFSGDINGSIQIWLPYGLATIITAAMLGMEPQDIEDEDSVSDVLMEVLNIVSGNLKTNLTNAGTAIDFEVPHIIMEGNACVLPEIVPENSERFSLIHDENSLFIQIAPDQSTTSPGVEEETPPNQPEEPQQAPAPNEPQAEEPIQATADTGTPPEEAQPVAQETPQEAQPVAEDEKFDVSYKPAEEESQESQIKLRKIVEALNEDLEEDKEEAAAEEPPEEEQELPLDQLDLIMDIPIRLTAELGRTRMRIEDLLKLGPGASVILSELENEPITILANNTPIARGMVVVENEKYGIRITHLTSRKDRLKALPNP